MTLPKNTTLFCNLAPLYMDRLMADFPWTDEDAAAAMGSAGHESLGFTLMQEIGPRAGRGGLGPFQWTGPRRVQFEAWLARHVGWKPSDFEAGYSFLFRELIGAENATVDRVRQAKGLYRKVVAFERAFERAGVPAWPKRLEWAELALVTYRARKRPAPDIPVAAATSAPSTKPASAGFFARLAGAFGRKAA